MDKVKGWPFKVVTREYTEGLGCSAIYTHHIIDTRTNEEVSYEEVINYVTEKK